MPITPPMPNDFNLPSVVKVAFSTPSALMTSLPATGAVLYFQWKRGLRATPSAPILIAFWYPEAITTSSPMVKPVLL